MAAEQETLFTLPPEDHLTLIAQARGRRDGIRRLIADHFAKRQALALRLNATEAEFEDIASGFGRFADAAAQVAAMRAAKDKRDRARADMRDALEHQRALKSNLQKAHAEVELAIGGVQRSLIDAAVALEPEKHETAQSLRGERQRRVADACVKVLHAYGGRASCCDLASLVGVSSHGLGGLIDADPRLRKTHDGRLNNLQTWYELVPEAKG